MNEKSNNEISNKENENECENILPQEPQESIVTNQVLTILFLICFKVINKNEIENLKKENSSMDVVSEIEDLTKDMIMQIYCSFNEEGLGPIKWWK